MEPTKFSLHHLISISVSPPSVSFLIFTGFLLNVPSPVFPFNPGHIEPVPGNSVTNREYPLSIPSGIGNTQTQNRSITTADILAGLAAPHIEGGLPIPHKSNISSASTSTSYHSKNQSTEKSHKEPSIFPRVPPTVRLHSSSDITSETAPSDSQHQYRRLHHYQRIQRQGMEPTEEKITPPGLEKDESASLITSADESLFSGRQHTTWTRSDSPTVSSADIERYLQDLYKKQTVASINSVDASQFLSPSLPMHSSSEIDFNEELFGGDSSSSRQGKGLFGYSSTLAIPQPLLPPSYINLATFRRVNETLEKSSSDILSRIANYWINLGRNATNNSHGAKSSRLSSTSSSSSSRRSGTSAPTQKISVSSNTHAYPQPKSARIGDSRRRTAMDGYDASLSYSKNHASSVHPSQSRDSREGSTESGSSRVENAIQTDQYIPMDDSRSNEDVIITNREQYTGDESKGLNIEVIIGGGDNANHVTNSGTSEPSVGLEFVERENTESNSFHEDLFHHTVATSTVRTATTEMVKEQASEKPSGSRRNSRRKSSSKSETSTGSSANVESTTSFGPDSKNIGNVRKTESDKIWSLDSHFKRNDLVESAEDEGHEYYYGMTMGGFLRRELWTIPLFVLAALNMVIIILFEVYVLCRANRQSRKHLFLGQMLLFGLFMCSLLALIFAVQPTSLTCYVGRVGVGITYSLIFSVLMVKCVFLLSLDRGVYLPALYQGLLLFFAVMVQVAIDTQWAMMYPPLVQTVEADHFINLQCGTSFLQFLYSLGYVGFLVLIVGFLAGRAAYQGVVENYKEAVYILITAVVTLPVAISWGVSGWMLQGRHQEACIAFGLVAHTLTIFLIMFMPKGRQLASLEKGKEKDIVCFEEPEDQCSGYAPSFIHYKPVSKPYKPALWGGKDGNLYTTLDPAVSRINPNVFFHRNNFHSGMIY